MSKTRKVRYPLKFVRVWDDNGQHALLDGLLDAVTGCSAWENSAGECLSFGARIPPSSFRLRCLGEGSSGAEELMGEAVVGTFDSAKFLSPPCMRSMRAASRAGGTSFFGASLGTRARGGNQKAGKCN
eukprot:COSAG02_NODE_93_length_37477_cov_78.101129_10_plen_128_part_00